MQLEPITREEALYAAIASGSVVDFEPETRKEAFLKYAIDGKTPNIKPRNRKEAFLLEVCKKIAGGGSGGGDSDYWKNVLARYIEGNITDMVIPDGTTAIADNILGGQSQSYERVTVPGSVKSIGEASFGYCENLSEIVLNEGLETIGSFAFGGCCKLKELHIPEGVTSIGANAFDYCEGLETITLPDSLTSIGEYCFNYCSSLKSITFPAGLKYIPNGTLYYCTALEEITFKGTPEEIYHYAFSGSSNVKVINVPWASSDDVWYEPWGAYNGDESSVINYNYKG